MNLKLFSTVRYILLKNQSKIKKRKKKIAVWLIIRKQRSHQLIYSIPDQCQSYMLSHEDTSY